MITKELFLKHKSKVLIACMLLILICSVGSSFASDVDDSLQTDESDETVISVDSAIDEVASADEDALQADDLVSADRQSPQKDGEKLSAANSSDELAAGEGTFSNLANKLNTHYLELDNDYVRSSYTGAMTIGHAMIIDGKGHYLDSQGSGAIFNIHTHENIIFKNITFKNAYTAAAVGGRYVADGELVFEDCTFIDNGGGISVNQDGMSGNNKLIMRMTFTNVDFINNNRTNTPALLSNLRVIAEFTNVNFINNTPTSTSTSYAGAIHMSSTFEGRFRNVNFTNNRGSKGGAIFIGGNYEATFNNVNFINNSAYSDGGAIYTDGDTSNSLFEDVIFTNNKVINNGYRYGGAIRSTKALNCNFTNVNFTDNVACIAASIACDSLIGDFNNVNFIGNNATYNDYGGGALYCSNYIESNFNNVNFTNNRASSGAAIYASCSKDSNSHVSFKNANFLFNTARSTSGAVYAFNCRCDFEDVVFINNTAGSSAGAVYLGTGRNSTFRNVDFINNSALTCGGAILFSSANNTSFTDVKFINNKVTKNPGNSLSSVGGGAIYITIVPSSTNLFKNVIFSDNHAYSLGGAVHIFSTSSSTHNGQKIIFEDCDFSNNTLDYEYGGAIFTGDALDIINCNFTRNKGAHSSAIGIRFADVDINITSSHFRENVGPVLNVNHYSYYGYKDGNLIISNSAFENNEGDAVKSTYNTNVTDCNFTDNAGRAFYFGGYENAVNILNNVRCINNTGERGSAIYNRLSSLNITNSTFLDNKASSINLTLEYNKFLHIIKIIYDGGNNYINAIDSDVGVNFNNVIFKDYDGIFNTDDVNITPSYKPHHAPILIQVYRYANDLYESFTMTADENGDFECYYEAPVIYQIVATHLDDYLYTEISSVYSYTWGDFDELQQLIINASGKGFVKLPRDYRYIICVDTITKGVFVNESMVIDGNGHRIDALNQSRIFRLEADDIELANIEFVNANGIEGAFISGVDTNNVKIDNCIFDNFARDPNYPLENDGGAIFITGNNTFIVNSQFKNLMARYGGAVYLTGFNSTISNSVFENCTALEGGAVYMDTGTISSLIDHSNFTNCNASYYGGAVSWNSDKGIIKSSNFNNNLVEVMGDVRANLEDVTGGGAIAWKGSEGLITESNFTNNRAAMIDISRSIFEDEFYGGAILLFGLNTNVSHSIFKENYAQSGGAVVIMNSSYSSINPVYINGNDSLEALGGFNSNVVECIFIDNFAQYGGAVLLGSYKNSILKSEFYNNTAYLGGAVALQGMNGVIDESIFENNVAHLGGAVVSGFQRNHNEIYIEYQYDSNSGEYIEIPHLIPHYRFTGYENSITNSTFSENHADSAGAVLWLDEKGLITDNTVFRHNSLENSYSRYADAYLRCYSRNVSQISYESIQTNPNSGVKGLVSGIEPKDYAGAVYWIGSDGLIYNVDFVENNALKGGALVQGDSSVLVDASRFVKNNATFGGAVWANNESFITNSNLSQNIATYGGAIYWFGANGACENSLMSQNDAYFGGAIYYMGEFNGISNCELTFNKGDYGSAIYFDSRGLTITSTVLLENQANSTSLISNVYKTIDSIVADVYFKGGDNLMNAIYTLSSNYALNNVTYWGEGGKLNTDRVTPRISDLEACQNITMEIFTYNTIVPKSVVNLTDIDGYTRVSIPISYGHYVVLVSHKENSYYTEINDTNVVQFDLHDPFLTVDVDDIFYKETARVRVSVADGATGNVTLYVDGAYREFKHLDGRYAYFDVPDLVGGVHNVSVLYSGDDHYVGLYGNSSFNVKPISSSVNVTSEGGYYSQPVTISFVLGPDDLTGEAVLTIEDDFGNEYNVTNAKSFTEVVSNLAVGKHEVTVYYKGDNNYLTSSDTIFIEIKPIDLPANAYATPKEIPSNINATFAIEVPYDYSGKVRITVDGESRLYNVTGSTILIFDKLFLGPKTAKIDFFDDKNYNNCSLTTDFTIIKPVGDGSGFGTVNADNMVRGLNSPYDYQAAFLDYKGNLLVNIDVVFKVNGKEYHATTNKDGIAQLSDSHLPLGTHSITSINLLSGEETVRQVEIVRRLSDSQDVTCDFDSGKYFAVKVWGDDGKLAPEGEFVSISMGKNHYVCKVGPDGYARLLIDFNPGTYNVITEYKGYQVVNKIVVKQTFKLVKKTIKVKKKAKKLVLKAKVKASTGKAIKGKVIKFKFRGKTYKAKTNKKGIAKVTIKKKVIRKLKKGKKYTFTAAYKKNVLKGKVKIKK
jgi:predicted outer membrane repeat protein